MEGSVKRAPNTRLEWRNALGPSARLTIDERVRHSSASR
jgi:hypothetical protein